MRQRVNLGVLAAPVNMTKGIVVVNINENPEFSGSLSQNYDAPTGRFVPDRQLPGNVTELALQVKYIDENSGSGSEITVDFTATGNTLVWSVNGTDVSSTSSSAEYYLGNGGHLLVRHNKFPSEADISIKASGTFRDTIGRVVEVNDTVLLTTVAGSDIDISLRVATGKGMAAPMEVVNVAKMMRRDGDGIWLADKPSYWRRTCCAQLYNGAIPLDPAYDSQYDDTPQGSAFYFWYYMDTSQQLQPITEAAAPRWAEGTWYADGSMGAALTVDLRYGNSLTVVCRAGYVPYGEYTSEGDDALLDGNGKIRTSIMFSRFQWREQRWRLSSVLPQVSSVDVASMSFDELDRKEVRADSTVHVIRRALVHAAGASLIDASLTSPAATAGKSVLERFFNVGWFLNNETTPISTGEWLDKTPGELGATNVNNMPSITLDVEAKTLSELTAPDDYTIADGVTVTQNPQPGDILYLNADGERVWVKNDNDQLTAANIPAGWTLVGYVYHRGKTDIIDGETDDDRLVAVINHVGTDEKYLDVVLYAWTDVVLDGEEHTKTMTMNITQPGGESAGDRDTVTVTYQATTLAEAAAAVQEVIEGIARAADTAAGRTTGKYEDLWHAYADEEHGRVIIQCDSFQSYRQVNQMSGVSLVSYAGTSANSTNGVRQDGTTGGPLNAARGTIYYGTHGTADTTLGLSGGFMTRASFDNSTNAEVIAYKEDGGTYESYVREYKMLAIPQPRRQGCFTLPHASKMSAAVAAKTAPLKGGGEKYIFPALHAAYAVGYDAPGLEQGNWYLHGVSEALYLMRDTDDNDHAFTKIAASAHKTGGTSFSNSVTRWLAQRYNVTNAWIFYGTGGNLNNYTVTSRCRVQAVTLIRL